MRREVSVLAEGRHVFGRRPKPRAAKPRAAKPREKRGGHYKDLTETGNETPTRGDYWAAINFSFATKIYCTVLN